jgi:recombination protein RecT
VNARDAARARAQGGQVATRPDNTPAEDPTGTMRTLLDRMKPELALALPRHMTPERMARQALTVFRTTEKLDLCTPVSFLGALMTCAQVGLEPGPQGHVYIVPFRNSRRVDGEWVKVYEATFILGYRGIIELARRSSELVDIAAHTVYQNEVDQGRFRVMYGTSPSIEHDPIVFGDRGEPVGYYATAVLKSGGRPFVVLSRADVDKFRLRSATQKDNPSGPWLTDYEAMAWKTCVRRLERWLPQSPELAAAIAHEDTVRHEAPPVNGQHTPNVLETQPPVTDDEAEPEAEVCGPGPDQTPAGPQETPPEGVNLATGEVADPPDESPWGAGIPDDDPWVRPGEPS